MSEEYKRKPNTACFVCHKSVYKRPSQIKANGERVFCGRNCYGRHCRKEIPCLVCGKLILGGLNKKNCSRACSNIHRTGLKYKTGSLKDKVKALRSVKVRLLSIRGKTCQRCKYDKYEILQVHHKDRNTQNNNLENLELICPNCHFEEHYLEKSWLNKINKQWQE